MQPEDESHFVAIARGDDEFAGAHRRAAADLHHFAARVATPGSHTCNAKLRFRDPDSSGELGEDQFLYVWLTDTIYHEDSSLYSAVFFELPDAFAKWHEVGERLAFDPEDIFDWMVIDNGTIHGGYTLRVTRRRLSEAQRSDYDAHLGALAWHPLPTSS